MRKKTASRSSSNNYGGVIAIMVSALVLVVLVGFVAMDQINKAAPNPEYARYAQGSVTLVVFHAQWWSYCRQQNSIVNGIGHEFGDTLIIERIDVDDPNSFDAVDYYGAYNIPYTLVLNEYGEVTHQFAGLVSANTLITAIETTLAASQPLPEPDV